MEQPLIQPHAITPEVTPLRPKDTASIEARRFLRELREEIHLHPAVNHFFLNRVATMPFTREDYKVFGLQHYPLVCSFTHYMENLLVRAPSAEAKQWLAKVLLDEYGEGTDGDDHATLYAAYLRAAGARDEELSGTLLSEGAIDFIRTHVRLTTKEPFLVGLGAIGPGHEWAIPQMFDCIVPGLRRAGFDEHDIRYFWVHQAQDEDHGAWLEEALASFAITGEARAQIREGAMLSLAARERFWTSVQHEIVRWRQPNSQKKLARKLRIHAHALLGKLGARAGAMGLVTEIRRRALPVYLEDIVPRVR